MHLLRPLGSAALLGYSLCTATAAAQTTRNASEMVARKSAEAFPLNGAAPSIDGRLDDPAWQSVATIGDFVQKVPIEGAPASERTEVAILFDDGALYVGARMYRADPKAISTSVTRRDGDSDAEVLTISLDTYFDRRTAYSFGISSGGVRKDYYHGQDSEENREFQFDPVWLAKARVDSIGWTAEMRIPFSQLRFSAKDEQVWGLEIKRAVPDKNEEAYWVMIPRAAYGFASHFGVLRGISGIRPSRRLEVVPYTAGDLTLQANPDPVDPFNRTTEGRAGADVKMGLGPNLTLDATVNPDFGQVEADPAEVNLTAFETFFTERRPFFVEGSEMLVGQGLSFIGRPFYFYSRRIGAPPRGPAAADYVKRPDNTTILGATKVTGRLGSGLTMAALASVTSREHARTYTVSGQQFGSVPVEPLTGFGAIRLQKDVGKQQSNLGWTLTNVQRSFSGATGLKALLPANALAGGTDFRFRFEQGKYEFTGFAGFSRVAGDTAAIRRLQRASAHNFQRPRPDQDHVTLDPLRTSLSGYTFSLRGDKNAGRWSAWGIQATARSPGFEINDLGQMRRADALDFRVTYGIRDTQVGRRLRYWRINHNVTGSLNYGWIRQPTVITQTLELTFLNFWRFNFRTQLTPRALSDELTRGGPLMGTPRIWNWQVTLANQPQARYNWSGVTSYGTDELGGWNYQVSGGITIRAAPRWQAQISPQYSRSVDTRQYVTTMGGGPTFGSRYVFAAIERSTLSAQLRFNYTLTPDFTLEAYAEPFAASGRFYDLGELSAPRSRTLRMYGTDGTTITRRPDQSYAVTDGTSSFNIVNLDFNRLSFRSNLVLRWEWARGSTFFLIWQQNRQAAVAVGEVVRPRSLWNATTAAGDNFLAVKISYWLSVR